MTQLLIDLQYLPPISYFILLAQYDKVWLESGDSFNKSTYRNRCYIAGPNGPLRLTIPIHGSKNQRTYYRNARISYQENWQKIHWQSICSSYRSSPYFEFYEEKFEPFFQQQYTYLYELNRSLLSLLLELLELPVNLAFTEEFEKHPSACDDYRDAILPDPSKSPKVLPFTPPTYRQVFEDKTGFIHDLSIVDLLFNEGPDSARHVKI